MEEEFSNVAWDISNSNHSISSPHLDPLSDISETLGQALETGHTYPTSEMHDGRRSPAASVDVKLEDETTHSEKNYVQYPLHNNNHAEPSSSSSSSSSLPQSQQPVRSSQGYNKILITDPRKENDYISYRIVSPKTSVRRRFQDFVWLYNVLYIHYPACFVPPLPDKHRMEYVKGDRFSSDFIERRRVSLQRYLRRIAGHPILQNAEFFVMFLESSEFNDASARALREGQETMMSTISDSLVNAFAKIRKRDEQFIEMKDRVDRLQDNLTLLEKTLLRTNKRTEDLSQDYKNFASSVAGLATHEERIGLPLGKFATGLLEYSEKMKEMSIDDANWLSEIHDSMTYYNAIKGILKLRDQKQLDFEELSDYLQSSISEREKTLHPRPGDSGFAGYFTGKINEARGADVDKIRREKVLRLDEQIQELQDAVQQTHEVSTAFSEQVKREDGYFARTKAAEMREALADYTGAKVEFYQKGAQIWRELAASLEQLG